MNRGTFAFAGLLTLALTGGAVAQDLDSAPEKPESKAVGVPVELTMKRGGSTTLDLRALPHRPPRRRPHERPERPEPPLRPVELPGGPQPSALVPPTRQVPAPPPIIDFDGLDRENWGAGSPPDTTGDVGPNHYIQSVNTSVGIYDKTTGAQITAFTFDTLMSQGSFGNQCDTENFGDPVVLYDTFEDRWVLTDFAFTLDGGGNVNPPEAFQCFAVSQSGDPVSGGWRFYSIRLGDALNDYPKLGVWPDGIYLSANMFGFPAGGSFQGVRVWAFNKAQMYSGEPSVQVVEFRPGAGDFTLLPSNARLQTGTPPAGTPNYFISSWNFLNALTVYKFHVDWNRVSLSTFTGPDVPLAGTSWPNAGVANVPQSGTATLLDALQIRAMMQNQYTNFGGGESLWVPHTVRRGNTTGFAAPRWYQVDVSGGTVAPAIPQAATWDPDAANVMHRFMPSLALDRVGNLALGYSTSSSTSFPSIKYAGRLASDPVNTLSLTEQTLFTGTASQTGSSRWGDYTTMTLDPDGCTFWFTNEYANPDSQAFDRRWKTRIGKFKYDECTPVGPGGTVEGTVIATTGGAPIAGATVAFGSRTTTTDGTGHYEFTDIPAGLYPSIAASAAGYVSATQTTVVVTDGGTTTHDFSLATAPPSDCPTDTSQADLEAGVGTNVDLTTSPGDVILLNAAMVNQQNTTLGTSGVGVTITTWGGQTFTPSASGALTSADINLFCSGCTGSIPNLTLGLRATAGGLPTGADIASATITGFSSGAAGFYTATFASPPSLTAGTQYALVIRPTANPAPGTYALTRSGTATLGADVYAGGTRVSGATSGTVWSIPTTGGVTTDAGFRVYLNTGFAPLGTLVSSLKDSNPAPGKTPAWLTLSWNATTPASTTLGFQVAVSNSSFGPFNFVGPDNTAGTFFTTSGASLAQFDGFRYLKYKAYLETTDSAATPTLGDVVVCYDTECRLATPAPTNTGPYCEGATISLATPTEAGATYAWTGPNGFASSDQNPTRSSATLADAGSYSVTTTIGVCTSAAGSTTVVVNPFPATPTASNGGPYCEGATISLSTPTVAGATYAWTGPNGFSSSDQNPTRPSATLADAGSYAVTVTVDGCPSAAGTTAVIVNPIPATPTASNGGPYCEGATISLSTPTVAGATYSWTGPNGFASSDQNPTRPSATLADAGAYSVTITVDGCPSAAGITNVVVDPSPATPTASNGGPYCEGATISLSTPAVAGATYSWTGPNGFASSDQNPTRPSATLADAGSYAVTITVDGCPSAAGTTAVIVNPIPATPTASNGGPYCEGATISLSTPTVAGATYTWTGPNGFSSSDQNPTRPSATLADAGSYAVTITVDGCPSAAGTTAVIVNPIPATPTASNGGPYIEGDTIALSTPLVAGATYSWTGPNAFTSSDQNPTRPSATLADAGAYSVTVTVDGCTSAAGTTDVIVQPAGTFYAVTPCRLLDTRQIGQGPPLSSGVPRILQITGSCGVPASATAVAINITGVSPTAYGHVTSYPGDAAAPLTSTLNFNAGRTRANNAIIQLAGSGSGTLAFRALLNGGGTVHLIVDVTGYFVGTTLPPGREGDRPPQSDSPIGEAGPTPWR